MEKECLFQKDLLKCYRRLKKEFTKEQINQINRTYQTGGRLVIKPTREQIEEAFLGTPASIGIPMAISLVSKMFGSGLQVDRQPSSNTKNVFFKLSRITKKILTATSTLLSFDLRKSVVEEREKRERSWCHNYLFLVSLLLVSNNINHH